MPDWVHIRLGAQPPSPPLELLLVVAGPGWQQQEPGMVH
jgi:hypothetical protein